MSATDSKTTSDNQPSQADLEAAQAKAAAHTPTGAAAESLPAPTASATVQADTEQGVAAATVRQGKKGDFGPFQDTAPPVGAALGAVQESLDIDADFEEGTVPFTIVEGDVQVAVYVHNQRNIVGIAPAGWNGNGQLFAPYQLEHLEKAIKAARKNLRKSS